MSRQVDVKALISHIVRGDGADRCRICMGDTSEGQVYLGDTVMMDNDRPVSLSELLEVITGVEINEDSLCPPGACVSCTSAVVAAQEFRSLVLSSQKVWYNAIECLGKLPTDAPNTSPLTPVKSILAFVKKDNLTVQIIKDYSGAQPASILHRLTSKPALKKKNEKKPRLARTGPPCDCTDCGQHFLSPYYLNLHLKNSGQKDACIICGTIVLRGYEMKEHLSLVHRQTTYLCANCPALFDKEAELKIHMKNAHKPGALTCGDCGRTFPRNGAFEAHSQMHAVRTCRACGAQFSNRGCYRKHRSRCEPTAKPDIHNMPRSKRSNVRDPATFICDYCNKTYHSRPQLKNHILWIHMDVRPHQCQVCGKRFYTPARLLEHTVVHTRERNWECDICGAKLVSKMAAVYHRRRHTGERPYECVDCGERFISASRRSEHAKRRHNKGVKFHCTMCAASFVRSHELRKHLEKAHKVESKGKIFVATATSLFTNILNENTAVVQN
ncbi:hypothetical protein O0L34_g752 [Tuta absoluta]|nr:hypothetical protein O0L34_g10901 [Tuta absoluta]KAJ2953179.1 hypothetical protein O0L34_g752 [Tuta absoluta]